MQLAEIAIRRHLGMVLLVAAATLATGGPARAAEAGGPPALAEGAALAVATVKATVEAVDLDTRLVTLKGEDGERVTIIASDEVRNLPQVKVGDTVTFEYYQLLALALEPVSDEVRSRTEVDAVGRAPLGEKPAAVIERTIDITGTVLTVDRKNRSVTLRGPERSLTLAVAEDVNLEPVKEGQIVRVRYVEGFGVSVTTPEN